MSDGARGALRRDVEGAVPYKGAFLAEKWRNVDKVLDQKWKFPYNAFGIKRKEVIYYVLSPVW